MYNDIFDDNKIVLDCYKKSIQKLCFEDIHCDSFIECFNEFINTPIRTFNFFKYKIEPKTIERLYPRMDIFFGLYSKCDECTYKIYLNEKNSANENKKLILSGFLLKNKLTHILPIIIVALQHNYIEVEVSEETYLLVGIVENELRRKLADSSFKIKNHAYNKGYLKVDETSSVQYSDFPVIDRYNIYTKLDSVFEDNEYKEKYGLQLTDKNKQEIMSNFDLFNYYLRKIKVF